MIIFFISLLLFGCGQKAPEAETKIQDKCLVITASKGMNHDSALTIDIVQVYEEYIWNNIVELSADDYFKKRKWVLQKNARIWTIEVTEEFWAKSFILKDYEDVCAGTILFANYINGRANKIRLKTYKDTTFITCGVADISKAESSPLQVSDAVEISSRK